MTNAGFFLKNIWVIPLLPLLGAVVMFFLGRGSRPAPAGGHDHGHGLGDHEPGPTPSAGEHTAQHHGHDDHSAAAHGSHGEASRWANPEASHSFVNAVCVGAVVVAFLWACLAFLQYTQWADGTGKPFQTVLYTWLGTSNNGIPYQTATGAAAPLHADCGFLLDPLSGIWLLFVTGVGMLIHVYSTGYMAHDGGYYRFFGYLNLFMFSMLTLILGNNFVMMFVGWEGVGLCSYLLIGFYFHRHSASTAANKAFIVNRVGDAGFILGMFTIAWYFGTMQFTRVTDMARSGAYHVGDPIITAACLLLFVGACGKSAQVPLYIWLPDAMEGPTPVSALIHAATMVTAGVYMVARSNALFTLAPTAMMVVAIVGAITAIFAASIGLVQNDIKRVLAYSTVSQLGYMFLALGVGAFAAGVFHVFTHAFFKALLFLGSGSVIHALSGEQDMRRMGALASKIPITYKTMLIATLAIAGIFPFAGFFSKDEILWQAWAHDSTGYKLLWAIGYVAAFMTAFYMFRLMYLTFWGRERESREVLHHVHESPRSMTVPLIILAFFALFAGFLGFPESLARVVGYHGQTNRFEAFLNPVFAKEAQQFERTGEVRQVAAGEREEEKSSPVEYLLMFASVGIALAGWGLAHKAYCTAEGEFCEPIRDYARPIYTTLINKYYVDEVYDTVFTGRRKIGNTRLGAMGLGTALWKFDANVIDGAVNGAGWMTRLIGRISTWWDKWIIDGLLVNGPAILTRLSSYPVRMLQWGSVQFYALVMTAGVLGFIGFYLVPGWVWHWMIVHLVLSVLGFLGVVVLIALLMVGVGRIRPRGQRAMQAGA
ncbi:MAG TPA: NADH-quinone oxidoreductase subunit L [Terriglobales bacterium]|nr:NADH-quinone oxidoreductase subunit L [Terriglobales bacterium]